MKRCVWCKREKALNLMAYSPRAADKRMSLCNRCLETGVLTDPVKRAEYRRLAEAARAFDPKRVAARDVYSKTEAYRASHNAATKEWRKRNPEKYRAQTALNNALRDGKLVKPTQCKCGATGRLHAHHKDYAQPLKVRWLCSQCHDKAHHGERTRWAA